MTEGEVEAAAAEAAAELAMSRAAALLDAVSSPARLQLLATVLQQENTGRCTPGSAAEAVGRSLRDLLTDVIRLQALGLVSLDDDVMSADLGVVRNAARDLDRAQPFYDVLQGEPVVGRFFRHGRLVGLPQDARTRQHLARALVHLIPAERVLTEEEVNTRLTAVYDDWASLRRLMVDLGVLTRRASSHYQRVLTPTPGGRSHV